MTESDIFIHPGDWFFSDQNTRVRTVLGSCVAVTLWHPGLKIGGMCHYLLPTNNQKEPVLNARYGGDAIALMLQAIEKTGGRPQDYQAKIFGGANMFDVSTTDLTVGYRNIELAHKQIAHYSLSVTAEDVGGECYRQLIFNINDGAVWVRQGTMCEEQQLIARSFDFCRLI